MRSSIRWRLQFWYAVMLVIVLTGFATMLYLEVRQARYRQLDADLVAGMGHLETALKAWPPHLVDPGINPPNPERGPPNKQDRNPPSGPPGRPDQFRPGPSEGKLFEDLIPPGWANASPANYYGVWRANGNALIASGVQNSLYQELVQAIPAGVQTTHGDIRQLAQRGPHRTLLVIGRSTEAITAELQRFAWQLILAGLLVLVVGCAGGWWISSRIFIPIAKITKSAADISVNNLSKRIDASEVESELVELVDVLNATFARLDAAFSQLVRFTADASHELRTPLAVLRSHAELALTRSRTEEYYQQTIETCLNSATRMTAIVDGLLTLARADAGGMVADRQSVELSDVVRETIRQLRPVAAKSQVSITKELEAVTVLGNSNLLGRVVSNLVENAIRYNRPGGSVRVLLLSVEDRVSLTVSDTGIGIPAADVPHIFERFYRVDQARTRSTGGTGLGLAICKSIIELHGGTIECVATENSGTTFRVQIPKQTVTEQ